MQPHRNILNGKILGEKAINRITTRNKKHCLGYVKALSMVHKVTNITECINILVLHRKAQPGANPQFEGT